MTNSEMRYKGLDEYLSILSVLTNQKVAKSSLCPPEQRQKLQEEIAMLKEAGFYKDPHVVELRLGAPSEEIVDCVLSLDPGFFDCKGWILMDGWKDFGAIEFARFQDLYLDMSVVKAEVLSFLSADFSRRALIDLDYDQSSTIVEVSRGSS